MEIIVKFYVHRWGSVENASIDNENPDYALWVEEDYCSPPLAMERENVLNQYFNDIEVVRVEL